MGIGASRDTALMLLATQAIFKMTSLEQLQQLRRDINSSMILLNDDMNRPGIAGGSNS